MDATLTIGAHAQIKRLNLFERYLSLWVANAQVQGSVFGCCARSSDWCEQLF